MLAVSKAHYCRTLLCLSLVQLFLSGAESALAQRNIGSAVTVERDVSGALAGRTRPINSGDGVFSNENIRTANVSAAQLQFLDQSKLAIGPSASVVLDRFIYNPDQTARQAVLHVSAGAARWVGGVSRPRAYQVRTPHAVIGVRGTAFDLLVEPRRTIVTLREGLIVVCPIGAPSACVTLATPGQVVVVRLSAVEVPAPAGPSATQFAERCLRPIDRAACLVTATAQLVTEPPSALPAPVHAWDGFYAGVHLGGISNQASVSTGGTASVLASIAAGNVPRSLEPAGEGVIGGIQVGYLWQFGQGVIGLEADLSAVSASAQENIVRSPFGVIVTTSAVQKIDYLGTIRGRAGIAVGNFLVFGTAGLAVGGIKLQGSIVPVPAANPTYIGQRSQLQFGFVGGGGIEYAITYQLSIRAEFLHYDLGTQRLVLGETTGMLPGEFATMDFRSRGNVVRAGLNVRF